MSTESEDPRRKAERTLREVEALLWLELEDCFKAGLDDREQQNNGFQKRIDRLDKLIEPPRQALDHVSSLQLKVLDYAAAGLSFFSTSSGYAGFNDGLRITIPAGAADTASVGRCR